MNAEVLKATAKKMVSGDRGILAIDESNGTCNKRFEALGIPTTLEFRSAYREWIISTPHLGDCINGLILYDETIRQSRKDGKSFISIIQDQGILPGIKVDTGAKDLAGHPGEKITEGLDGLRDRLKEYYQMGARFCKWRAVITLGKDIPSQACLAANAQALARYAALCQEADLVPMIESEVIMNGHHSIEQSYAFTEASLRWVFEEIRAQNVLLEGMILKPNMILSGLDSKVQASNDRVGDLSIQCFLRNVPAAVPGIAFLSGGQSGDLATARLNSMNLRFKSLPWELSFSFARAIQHPAINIWEGKESNIVAAQKALYKRAADNVAARRGEFH
jgi:fructose-bisphosphate aldolase class I